MGERRQRVCHATWDNSKAVFINVHFIRFATNMIVDYWSNISPTDPDRVLFEEIQSKKKDPIVLISPQPKVAQVISHASPSPPSSPVVKPVEESQLEQVEVVTEEPKGNKITNIISSFLYGGGKKKDTTEDVETEKKQSTESSSSSSSSPKPVQEQKKIDELYKKVTVPTATGSAKGKEKEVPVPRLPTPTVVAVENDDDDDDDEDFSPATTSPATTSADGTGTEVEELDVESVEDMAVDDEDEEVIKRPSRSANVKRTRSAYTDYFIEQHKKRKLYGERKDTEEEDDDDEGSVASSIESNDKKKEPTDTIIFDDSFAKDASLDWNKLAKKVEYIGREVENGPIYCIVSW